MRCVRCARKTTHGKPIKAARPRVDRRKNQRFLLGAKKPIAPDSSERILIQGTGTMTPDGLASLTCVDLTRGLRDGESLFILV